MTYARGMDLNDVNRAHPLGVRSDNIMHQCPECGFVTNLFCTTCYGEGVVTEQALGVWQMRLNATVNT